MVSADLIITKINKMKKFIKKMLHLGAELQKADDGFHCSMIINDAEILYKNEIEALTIPVVSNCTTCNDEINYKGVCEMCYTELKLNDLD